MLDAHLPIPKDYVNHGDDDDADDDDDGHQLLPDAAEDARAKRSRQAVFNRVKGHINNDGVYKHREEDDDFGVEMLEQRRGIDVNQNAPDGGGGAKAIHKVAELAEYDRLLQHNAYNPYNAKPHNAGEDLGNHDPAQVYCPKNGQLYNVCIF